MRLAIVLTVLVGLVSGVVGAWGSTQLSREAGAAPPPPGDQKVREQNLDGSGFIRVHEQGTANVNVVSLPSQQGRIIDLGLQAANPLADAEFPFADVSDCAEMLAMAQAPHAFGTSIEPSANTSPDGTVRIAAHNAVGPSGGDGVRDGFSTASALISGPFRYIQLRVFNGANAPATLRAWIWCES